MRKLLKIARIYLIAQNTDLDPLCCGWRRLCHGLGNGGSDGGTTWCRRCGCVPVSVCHQFLTLAPVLSKLGLCGKSTVFTYEIGFLGMFRNRLWRSSRFFVKKNKEAQRVLSHTTGLLSSSALQGCLERLKRSTPGREKRFSLETNSDNYKTGSAQFRIHRVLGVIFEQSVLLGPSAMHHQASRINRRFSAYR